MTFWSETALSPKRNFRWQLRIMGHGSGNETVWWAKTVNTPSFDVSEVAHDYFDNKFFYPGRVTWSDLEVTLVDPVTPDAAKLTLDIINKTGYNITTAPGPKKTISKEKASSKGLKSVIIDVLNADGVALETWTLKNAWIKAVKFGDLDYSNDELRQISITFKYDWAECKLGDSDPYFERIAPEG